MCTLDIDGWCNFWEFAIFWDLGPSLSSVSMHSPPKLRRMIAVPELTVRPGQQLCDPYAGNQISAPQQLDPQRATSAMVPMHAPLFPTNPGGGYPTLSPLAGAEAPDGNPPLQRQRPLGDHTPRQQAAAAGVFLGTPTSSADTVCGDFEQQLIDRAVGDLPTVFSEVFTMQKGQTTEIQRLHKHIHLLKEKLAEGEERRDEVKLELKSVVSKTYLIGESIVDKHKACKQLSNEMNDMVKEENHLQRKVSRAEEEKDAELKLLNRHRKKKSVFAESMKLYEELNSAVYKELQETTRRLSELKSQKAKLEDKSEENNKLLSGELEKELQSDIEHLNIKTQEACDEGKSKEREILTEKQKQKQLEQSIQVMHKRNAAQLTRLKRQLKDVQQRNRHWQNQVSQLEEKISQAKSQLDN